MSWADDTDILLADGGSTVTVTSATTSFSSSTFVGSLSSATVETATVQIFPDKGTVKKDSMSRETKGVVVASDRKMFFPATSSVSELHRVYESGDTDYHEVLFVGDYNGHKQVYTHKVDNR